MDLKRIEMHRTRMEMRRVRPYWQHLRIPFAMTLAPIYLWGYFLTGSRFGVEALAAFIGFHFFLYPGITAYNSAYDRDEGPVGGMLRPPGVPGRLLEFSLAVQVLGAAFVPPRVLPIYLLIGALGIAYSHPALRWKGNPFASSLTVALGQGGLGCLAGWIAAGGGWSPVIILGAAVASLTTLGLYPVGQVFQVEEDARRGDRTLAVAFGPAKALRFGMAMQLLAGMAAVALMVWRYTTLDAALIATAYTISIVQMGHFARHFDRGEATVASAFRTSMSLTYLTSGAFLLFIAVQMVARA